MNMLEPAPISTFLRQVKNLIGEESPPANPPILCHPDDAAQLAVVLTPKFRGCITQAQACCMELCPLHELLLLFGQRVDPALYYIFGKLHYPLALPEIENDEYPGALPPGINSRRNANSSKYPPALILRMEDCSYVTQGDRRVPCAHEHAVAFSFAVAEIILHGDEDCTFGKGFGIVCLHSNTFFFAEKWMNKLQAPFFTKQAKERYKK